MRLWLAKAKDCAQKLDDRFVTVLFSLVQLHIFCIAAAMVQLIGNPSAEKY